MEVRVAFDLNEFRALRAEILLRIALQNLTLLSLPPIFLAVVIASLQFPEKAYGLAATYVTCGGVAALVWAHSGARTLQIKVYMRSVLEPRLRPDEGGWERWHAENRVAGILGSRWFVSTKGVLVGSQVAMLCVPVGVLGNSNFGVAGVAAVFGIALTLFFLTPPKLI
jgi:hypothetical protein